MKQGSLFWECGEFECRVLPVFEIPALTIYNRRAGIHISFMHSSPQTLEIYSIRPPSLGICSTFSAVRPPNRGICSTFSGAFLVQGGPQILEFAALSVQGVPRTLEFAALSVQRDPQILEFAAFAEFPVIGSKKLNRWSAPRTRSERDQNEMQICTFWPQLRGRQGLR